MGYRNRWRFRKFYFKQVDYILALIKRKYSSTINDEQYLRMCEQLGEEPDLSKMPPSDSDFPLEVQLAFFIHSVMPDRWEGMSGHYLGKDWSSLEALLNIHEVEDKKTCVYFLKIIESYNSESINRQIKQKQDATKRSGKAGKTVIGRKG